MPSDVQRAGSYEAKSGESDAPLRNGAHALRPLALEPEVAVLRWPSQQQEREELARRSEPRLLLLSPGGAAPVCTSCLEDWVRLPVDEADVHARLYSLAEHRRTHAQPTIDEFGIVRQDGSFVILSPTEHALAGLLISNFGEVVLEHDLEQRVVSESASRRTTLRTHTSRLRKRVAPLGLTVTCVRNVGYMMHPTQGSAEMATQGSAETSSPERDHER